MITAQDPEVADRLRRLRAHGMSVSDLARHGSDRVVLETYPEPGFNYRMTDMQAALGLCQMNVLEHVLERRRVLAERYNAALAGMPCLETPFDPPYAQRTWQSYCVRVVAGSAIGRTELMQRLLDDGIVTRRGVMAIHEELAYAGYAAPAAELPHTEAAARDVVMLPLFPDLSFEQQDYVVERLAAHAYAQAA
jgi:dTDP-4-amino-4,6-dideoxygalactose transaminase